jgi:hypothetical protein
LIKAKVKLPDYDCMCLGKPEVEDGGWIVEASLEGGTSTV